MCLRCASLGRVIHRAMAVRCQCVIPPQPWTSRFSARHGDSNRMGTGCWSPCCHTGRPRQQPCVRNVRRVPPPPRMHSRGPAANASIWRNRNVQIAVPAVFGLAWQWSTKQPANRAVNDRPSDDLTWGIGGSVVAYGVSIVFRREWCPYDDLHGLGTEGGGAFRMREMA